MMRSITLATTVVVGMSLMPHLAGAESRCPSGFTQSQGRCYPEAGRHAPTQGYLPESGFYREDTSRNWNNHRNRDDNHRSSQRRYRTYDDGRLRDPERYGLPPLPRGQHYQIIDGQVVRMRDGYGGTRYRSGSNNSDGFQSLLNSLFR